MDQKLLKVRGLKTHFFTDYGVVKAIDNVDFEIDRDQVVGIVGESGCGKSTLAYSILRLVRKPGKIMGGEIYFEGKDLLILDEKDLRKIRGKSISMIFQDPSTSLNPVYTIGYQIGEAIRLHQDVRDKNLLREKVVKVVSQVGITDGSTRFSHYPHEFSGGMRQRVMIAMAISCNPKLLIADEPTTSLDVTIQAQVLEVLKELQKKLGSSILLITHNLGLIAEMCDFVYVMYSGKILEYGDVYTIFKNPKHPYTYMLMSSVPKIVEREKRLKTIPGSVPDLINLPPGCVFADRCEFAMSRCNVEQPELVDFEKGHKVACFSDNSANFYKNEK